MVSVIPWDKVLTTNPEIMYNKFIITMDGELRFGNVYLHRELLPEGQEECHGGGLWKIDNQRGCIILYGRSFDFGLPDFEFVHSINRGEFPGSLGYPIFYMRSFAEQEILEPVII